MFASNAEADAIKKFNKTDTAMTVNSGRPPPPLRILAQLTYFLAMISDAPLSHPPSPPIIK
jgi:hypothetical protein